MTQAIKDRIIGSMAAGADVVMAAQVNGVSKSTIYNHREKDQAFADAMDEQRAKIDQEVVESLLAEAKAGNVTAMIFWLKNRRSDEWRDRRQHEITGADDGPVVIRQIVLEDGTPLPSNPPVVPDPSGDVGGQG